MTDWNDLADRLARHATCRANELEDDLLEAAGVLRSVSATLAAREALLRRAMEGLTGMDFYSDRRALAAEIAAALNQEQLK